MTVRLALYSDQEGPANSRVDARLLQLIAVSRPRIGYFSSSPDPDRAFFERKRAYYARIGAHLQSYVDAACEPMDSAVDAALRCDAIHLSGGNTYAFLRWLRHHGLLPTLRAYAEAGGVLVGASAGAILMTPDIRTAALCGDVHDATLDGYQGLGLTSFLFWPHHPGCAATGAGWSLSLPRDLPVYACPDGSGIVVEGSSVEALGEARPLQRDSGA
jgi:dipeptidase E